MRAVLGILCGAALALVGPLAGLLAWHAETRAGRAAGLTAFALAAWPGAWMLARRTSRRVPGVLAAVACGGLAVVLADAPSGTPAPGAAVRSEFLGQPGFARYSPFNLVPEIDQVRLGAAIAPDFAARVDPSKSGRILDLTMPLYRAIQADPDYRAIGSAMDGAFADLFGLPFDRGHYFAYVPRASSRLPVLLFLHGSGGNFVSYLKCWQQLADREGIAVVCPSFGFGRWSRAGGVAAIDRVLAHLAADPALDLDRVVLAGLSSGAAGAARVAAAHPGRFRALVLISPVLAEPDLSAGQVPLTVIHGDADEVIPPEHVAAACARLAAAGVRLRRVVVPGEDHFLLFGARERVFAEVAPLFR